MNPEQRYEALAKAFLGNSNVSQEGKGFGSEALKTRGRIFAMLSQGTLVVKLPKARVDALVDAGEGHRFDPRHDGRVMKEWLALAVESQQDWLPLAEEALTFVDSKR